MNAKLKEFRKQKKLTQKDMAKNLGVSKSYYSKVEALFQCPSYMFLIRLKNKYPEVNIDEMFF